MGDYKLVPVELLKDWHERINTIAAEMAFNVADEMESMLATTPAVQGEPVAWGAFYSGGKYSGQLHRFDSSEEQIDSYIAIVHRSNDSLTLRKGCLYTAPQPSPDVDVLVEALSALRGCIMETRGPDAYSALVLADAALAAYREGAEE